MIPMNAATVKPAKDIRPGDIGFYFKPEPVAFVAGPIQNGLICAALFDAESARVLDTRNLFGSVIVLPGAEIEIDPSSARKAPLGFAKCCPVFAGANRYLEIEYQMDLYQVALGSVDEAANGDRLAFDRWRIVLRHDGTEYEILSRAPAPR